MRDHMTIFMVTLILDEKEEALFVMKKVTGDMVGSNDYAAIPA
jgi:hypothetical protein